MKIEEDTGNTFGTIDEQFCKQTRAAFFIGGGFSGFEGHKVTARVTISAKEAEAKPAPEAKRRKKVTVNRGKG